jgi:RNA polymerase sigma factor (sigma-70 family)
MDSDADADELAGHSGEIRLLSNQQPELEAEPEDGLVTYMALRDEDFDLAQRACGELYRRHARLMAGWCLKNRAETYGRDAEDLVNEAFLHAFRSAHSFRSSAGLDADGRRRHVIAWLFRILRNVYLACRKAEQREPLVRDDSEDADCFLENVAEPDRPEDAGRISPQRRNLVHQFLEAQNDRDRAILKATGECWSAAAGETVLSADVRDKLCEEFGMNQNSLRVQRKRLIEKLRIFISQEETKTSPHHEHRPKR